jgi:hypothetical protein
VKCFFCRSSNVRLSHFRLFDLPWLLTRQIPVRCHSCRERDYVKLSSAWHLIFGEKPPRNRQNNGKTSVESA